jgi:Alpha amylase, catalytic domain
MRQLYEMNIRTWQSERSAVLGRPATFDDLDNDALDDLVERGFNWLYLIGVWPTGSLSRQVAVQDETLRTYLSSVLPDFNDTDLIGSPFAPADYTICTTLGGEEAFQRLRTRARSAGISLMLDFIPNHVGIDHPWVKTHPEYFIAGDEQRLAAYPTAFCRLGEGAQKRIFAHGRDPFFAPWRSTVQLDYSNPEVPQAMMRVAANIAAKCDGLRCDMAMLLLQDVFENTWKRPIAPFWRRCLEFIRSEHPGTLTMAEVYWNREYELQQAGFDYTFDKILYDRLLSSDAESIRAHLRATLDYQEHGVRFIENHAEQRAAARFTNPEHYRGALLITAMVPGMLLLHYGQEDGRRLHASYHCRRRPPELGSEAHRTVFQDVLHVLDERARQEGKWRLLEPKYPHGNALIGCLWSLPGHHDLVIIVNASWDHVSGSVQAGPLSERDTSFHHCLPSMLGCDPPFIVRADQLRHDGIHVQLPPWGSVVYRAMPVR